MVLPGAECIVSARVPYTFLDHTADVAVELSASTLEGLYAAALQAFTDTVTDRRTVEPAEAHELEVEAAGPEELMVEWLGELVYRFDVDGLLFARADVRLEEADDGLRLAARALGESFDPDRHPLKVVIKGVTYHGLDVREEEDGWHGKVVFDI